jgi:hypothetical protein
MVFGERVVVIKLGSDCDLEDGADDEPSLGAPAVGPGDDLELDYAESGIADPTPLPSAVHSLLPATPSWGRQRSEASPRTTQRVKAKWLG